MVSTIPFTLWIIWFIKPTNHNVHWLLLIVCICMPHHRLYYYPIQLDRLDFPGRLHIDHQYQMMHMLLFIVIMYPIDYYSFQIPYCIVMPTIDPDYVSHSYLIVRVDVLVFIYQCNSVYWIVIWVMIVMIVPSIISMLDYVWLISPIDPIVNMWLQFTIVIQHHNWVFEWVDEWTLILIPNIYWQWIHAFDWNSLRI